LEAPPNSITEHLDGIFNLTLTYRRDSDIFSPYGWLEKIEEKVSTVVAIKPEKAVMAYTVWYCASTHL